jgi:tRNA G10  N-methylase Trm11
MEFNFDYLEEKRNYLNKLIEKNPLNLLTTEIIKASQELDLLICEYQKFIKDHSKPNNK